MGRGWRVGVRVAWRPLGLGPVDSPRTSRTPTRTTHHAHPQTRFHLHTLCFCRCRFLSCLHSLVSCLSRLLSNVCLSVRPCLTCIEQRESQDIRCRKNMAGRLSDKRRAASRVWTETSLVRGLQLHGHTEPRLSAASYVRSRPQQQSHSCTRPCASPPKCFENFPFGRNVLNFSFESSESHRVFNYLHDSNSIFRAAGTNSEKFFGSTGQVQNRKDTPS